MALEMASPIPLLAPVTCMRFLDRLLLIDAINLPRTWFDASLRW
jgi:hypothetical protein